MKKLILAAALLAALPVHAANVFEFTYKDKGAYEIQSATIQLYTSDSKPIVGRGNVSFSNGLQWKVSEFSASQMQLINDSSNPNYIRAKFTMSIRLGETEHCSQSWDPQTQIATWDTWSKGTTQLKNRCRTKNFTTYNKKS